MNKRRRYKAKAKRAERKAVAVRYARGEQDAGDMLNYLRRLVRGDEEFTFVHEGGGRNRCVLRTGSKVRNAPGS